MRHDDDHMKMLELRAKLCKAFEHKAKEIRLEECGHDCMTKLSWNLALRKRSSFAFALCVVETRKFSDRVVKYVVYMIDIDFGEICEDVFMLLSEGGAWDKFAYEWHMKHKFDVRDIEFCILEDLDSLKYEWLKDIEDTICKVAFGECDYSGGSISICGVKVLGLGGSLDELCVEADIQDVV